MNDKIKAFVDRVKNDPEMQACIEAWCKKQERLVKIVEFQQERFNAYVDKHGFDNVMEKLLAKYDSNEYRDREYKARREPQESLLWFMLEYAATYGVESTDSEHVNMFTGSIYQCESYVIQSMHGQGSAVKVDKL